jgi:hypothetical protein
VTWTSREAAAFDRWLTTEPERGCEWCGSEDYSGTTDGCTPDCCCPQCENERALDLDADRAEER